MSNFIGERNKVVLNVSEVFKVFSLTNKQTSRYHTYRVTNIYNGPGVFTPVLGVPWALWSTSAFGDIHSV